MIQHTHKIDLTKMNFIPTKDELDIWLTWGDVTIGNIRYRMDGKLPPRLVKINHYEEVD